MRIKKIIALTTILLSTLSLTSKASDDITWMANTYPPYSYIDENGNNTGFVVEVVGQMMEKMGSKQTTKDIEITTFSKFFVFRNDNTNSVFFPIAKTKERADHFKWVGPIATNKPVLIANTKNKIKINNSKDLNSYSIAAIEGYVAISQLMQLGAEQNIFKYEDTTQESLKKLKAGIVDMVLCDELVCDYEMQKLNMKKNYEVVYRMQATNFSLAINKNTSDEIVNKLEKALAEVKSSKDGNISAYDAIVKKYDVK